MGAGAGARASAALSTDEDRRDNRRREHRLGIVEMDEEAMALWRQRFPQDIINECEFYA